MLLKWHYALILLCKALQIFPMIYDCTCFRDQGTFQTDVRQCSWKNNRQCY